MRLVPIAAAAAAMTLAASLAQAESYTTRIEPRAFYGATVTIEEGVRVFRPLPTTRHVIVNPGGATPLSLSYNDTRVVEHSTSTNYNYHEGPGVGSGGGAVGGYYGGFFGGHGHNKQGANVGGFKPGGVRRHHGGSKGHH